mgnify:FL=1
MTLGASSTYRQVGIIEEENLVFYTILVLFGLSHIILDKLIIDM